ncbi:MAG: Ig-like domain-containing protein, partial [Propionibacteriaceae bacterium]|nr:Ig-like domain-containing protein [Propionibacteriaceae bacterium]
MAAVSADRARRRRRRRPILSATSRTNPAVTAVARIGWSASRVNAGNVRVRRRACTPASPAAVTTPPRGSVAPRRPLPPAAAIRLPSRAMGGRVAASTRGRTPIALRASTTRSPPAGGSVAGVARETAAARTIRSPIAATSGSAPAATASPPAQRDPHTLSGQKEPAMHQLHFRHLCAVISLAALVSLIHPWDVRSVAAAAPIATQDGYLILPNTVLQIAAPGVLGNDADPDGDPLAAVLVTGVTNGFLTLNPDGSLTYQPNAGFVGIDTFDYQVDDGTELS